jgi:hypothetical protein
MNVRLRPAGAVHQAESNVSTICGALRLWAPEWTEVEADVSCAMCKAVLARRVAAAGGHA